MTRPDGPEPEAPRGGLALQTFAMPADTNANGDIFGGWLMAQMDLGGSVLARERARGRVATVQVETMSFLRPVHVGDLVTLYAEIEREGRSSLRIAVEAWVTRMETSAARFRVTAGVFTFVAIGTDGKSRPLPAA